MSTPPAESTSIQLWPGSHLLEADLVVPPDARGVVLFAHGSGSSRKSSRNRRIAERLHRAGFATLLLDLLTEEEEAVDRRTAHLRFDVEFLTDRVTLAVRWLEEHPATASLPLGLFGASTGAAAALAAAAAEPHRVRAVVSRGGRPDLAGDAIARVEAPTLLVVGSRDYAVLDLNEQALERLSSEKRLEVIDGAGHLFEEPGALDRVAELAASWFGRHLADGQWQGDGGDGQTAEQAPETSPAVRVHRGPRGISALVAEAAEPIEQIEGAPLEALLERIGDAHLVLLGEASHGTSEFYRMRQEITRALIERRGFSVVAVEADWPDAEHVDEYVRDRPGKSQRAQQAFDGFPSWMWRNHEVLSFVEWLRRHNLPLEPERRVGFYGLDVYSLYTSIHEVLRYLEQRDPELARLARSRYGCLTPFQADPGLYGSAVITNQYRDCEEEVADILNELMRRRLELTAGSDDPFELQTFFDAQQNARVVQGAEQYYRIMYYGSPESWNLRDGHMFETLQAILELRGPETKAVVWAHNSHIGRASATYMGEMGQTNIGEMTKDAFGDDAYLIGFGTHSGTVAAASYWGGDVQIMEVRPSHPRSYERVFHESGVERFLLPLARSAHAELREELLSSRLERAIGVLYRPDTELQSHYFDAVLPEQFDEFIWFDESTAVRPIGTSRAPELPERHPFLLAD